MESIIQLRVIINSIYPAFHRRVTLSRKLHYSYLRTKVYHRRVTIVGTWSLELEKVGEREEERGKKEEIIIILHRVTSIVRSTVPEGRDNGGARAQKKRTPHCLKL